MRDSILHLCLQGATLSCQKTAVRWLVCLCQTPVPDATQLTPHWFPVYISICAPETQCLTVPLISTHHIVFKGDKHKMAHERALSTREQKDHRFEQKAFSSLLVYSKKNHRWFILGEVQIRKFNSVLPLPPSSQPENRT